MPAMRGLLLGGIGDRIYLESRNVILVIRDRGACIVSDKLLCASGAIIPYRDPREVGVGHSLTPHRYPACVMLQQKFEAQTPSATLAPPRAIQTL